MGVGINASHPKLRPSVTLTGTAKEGSWGPPIGLVDIGVSKKAYLFRVALPGAVKDQSSFKCDIQGNGRVYIQGVVPASTLLTDSSPTVYRMRAQQLCPPGPFSISFNLPGPVEDRLFFPTFRPDGILEVVIMKSKLPTSRPV